MTAARRHDLIAVTILALLATILFADVVIGTHNFYLRDLTSYYYPVKQIQREIVLDGEFPYWNRRFGGGQPIAANPEHEVFYPLTWLILLPDYFDGFRLLLLVHVYIALFGMYALVRSMGVRAVSAFIGALSFGLGGVYLSYINLLPYLFCAAWLPWTCLFVRRYLLRPAWRDFALASLSLGMQFLIGEPTTVMQTGFLLGMYALYRGWHAARDHGFGWKYALPEMLTRVVAIGLISIAAVAVGAAQLFPALDHVGDSARARPFEYALVSTWSMPWAKLAEAIYPNVLGHISIDRVSWYWGGGLYPRMGSPFLFNVYSGLLVAALIAAAIFVRPRGGRFVLIVSAFSVVMALGGNTPLLSWLYEAGIAQTIRYPEKFILMAVFACVLLASQLIDRLLDGDEALRQAAMGVVAAITFVATIIALAGFTNLHANVFLRVWAIAGPAAGRAVEISHIDWIVAAIRGALLLAMFWLLPRIGRAVWVTLLAAFVVADVAPIVHELSPRVPEEFFRVEPAALRRFPPNRDAFRVFHAAEWQGREETAVRYFSVGRSVHWIVRNGLYPMTPAGYGLNLVMERDYDRTNLLPTIDFVDSVWDLKRAGRADWWRPPMAMSNAWYRGEYRPFEAEMQRVRGRVGAAEPIEFLESVHQPRYYFANQLVTIRNRHDFVRKLRRGDYGRSVAFTAEPSFIPSRGVVHDWRETANTAAIDVESFGRGFLVMSVTPHKYWRITVDGNETPAIVTNIGYQGIVVPPGRHRVEMRYRNHVVANALKVSIAAVLLLVALAFVPHRRLHAA